ncbi:MAG: lamin tail domain-containing protein [Anaerolineales bacterium]|jgi:hypothetical protein
MQSWRRLVYFLLLNVLVSALTVWVVVSVMLRNNTITTAAPEEPTLVLSSGTQAGEVVVTQTSAVNFDEDATEVVSEILEIKSVIGMGELETERVLIEHVGDKEVSLNGWQLQDQDGHVYTFPALTMFSGGAVTVYTRAGTSSVVELYWGLDAPIWSAGEKAYLLDPEGTVQAVFVVP